MLSTGWRGGRRSVKARPAPATRDPVSMPDTLAPAERATIVAELRRSRDAFLAAVRAVPPNAWQHHSAPGRWSPGEIAEHVIKIECGMRKFLPNALATTRPDAARRGSLADGDARLIQTFQDRSTRRTAPEEVRPEGGRYATAEQAAADFAAARDAVIAFAETTDADLRAIFVPHPATKRDLDGYQWLLFVAFHTDRHTAQIAESLSR